MSRSLAELDSSDHTAGASSAKRSSAVARARGRGQDAVRRDRSDWRILSRNASIAFRRYVGPLADEIFLHCRPTGGVANTSGQAEAVYKGLLDALDSEGVGPEVLVAETAFVRPTGRDFELTRLARSRVLGQAGRASCRAATTYIGQRPLGGDARLELSAVAVIPRCGSSSSHEVRRASACSCATCVTGARARIVRLGDDIHLHSGNVYGSGRNAVEEAYDMFRVAEGLLADAGMDFGDVVRTWIHVRDIDRDYAALNEARRAFFRRCGIERRPASTGVQGIPGSEAHAFSLSLHAVTSPRPLAITPMRTPLLNEAWTYGADFSRGLRIAEANKTTLYVSGTASIDEAGRTVHVGNLEAQVDRMLDNIASLLAGQGAAVESLVSGVTYVKRADDAPIVRSMLRQRGFDRFPCTIVEAPLCRPDLLCEAEAVAILPAGAGA